MKKALLYLRVSTAMQEERDSLSKQKEESLAFIQSRGFKLHKIIEEVESGRNTEREGLKDLEYEIKNKTFDILVFYSLSRLGRVQYDIHKIIDMAHKNSISYYSVSESFISSDNEMGRMMLGIMASLAEQESATISKRVSGRMRAYAAQGYFLQKPPFGFDVKDKVLVENEDADKVREIFRAYLSGESRNSLSKRFGKHTSTITEILKNVAYAGYVQFGGRVRDKFTGKQIKKTPEVFKGLHTPIISEPDFDMVQRLLHERYIKPVKSLDNDLYLLGGLLKCGNCGVGYHGQKAYDRKKKARQKSYYRCSGSSAGTCKAPYIGVDDIEAAVVDTVKEFAKDKFMILDTTSSKSKKIDNSVRIETLKDKRKRIVEIYLDGNIARDEYVKRLQKLDNEILLLEGTERKTEDINNMRDHFINLLEDFDSVSRLEKKMILRVIIKEIIILNKEEFEITLNIS